MEFRQIQYFLAVAEQLHFRRAAEMVHVAQPALSQQIQKLEDEIGQKLFDRTYHKVHLTPAGKAFYEKTCSLLDDASQAIQHARRAGRGEMGSLSIGYVSSAALRVLPPALVRLRADAPLVEIDLREDSAEEQIDALHRGKLDVGLFHAKLEEEAFATTIIDRERLMLALPECEANAPETRADLNRYSHYALIVPTKHKVPGYYEQVRAAYALAHAAPASEYSVRTLQTALLLVAGGLGIAVVPESFQGIQVQGVAYRQLGGDAPQIDLIAAWRRDNASPLLARFVEGLRDIRRNQRIRESQIEVPVRSASEHVHSRYSLRTQRRRRQIAGRSLVLSDVQ